MNQEKWNKYLDKLERELEFLPDKPEENGNSTLQTLALLSTGKRISVKKAMGEKPEWNDLDEDALDRLVKQRLSGIPLAHLTGRQSFMGVELIAGPQALVPRVETEILGNAVKEIIQFSDDKKLKLLDVCTGSGNLAVALAVLCPKLHVSASDLSEEAVELASQNVKMHGLENRSDLRVGDFLEPFREDNLLGSFDILMCNPPYISSSKVFEMSHEISDFEPSMAFDGGPFGIKFISRLIKESPLFLKKGGWVAFEIGLGQGEPMKKRLEKGSRFDQISSFCDEDGNIRALRARYVG